MIIHLGVFLGGHMAFTQDHPDRLLLWPDMPVSLLHEGVTWSGVKGDEHLYEFQPQAPTQRDVFGSTLVWEWEVQAKGEKIGAVRLCRPVGADNYRVSVAFNATIVDVDLPDAFAKAHPRVRKVL